jgi:hypothetical protein
METLTVVNFNDPQLKECYDRNFETVVGFSDEMRQVCALIATHDFFQMMEGPHSARVHETIDHLLSPRLRDGLREWYRRCGAEMDRAAIEFRDQLSQLAEERLEDPADMPLNPS